MLVRLLYASRAVDTSAQAIEAAHGHPEVHRMWAAFGAAFLAASSPLLLPPPAGVSPLLRSRVAAAVRA